MSLTPKIRLGLCCDLHPLLSELDHLSSQCSHLSSKRTCQPSLPGQRGARWDGSIPPLALQGSPRPPACAPEARSGQCARESRRPLFLVSRWTVGVCVGVGRHHVMVPPPRPSGDTCVSLPATSSVDGVGAFRDSGPAVPPWDTLRAEGVSVRQQGRGSVCGVFLRQVCVCLVCGFLVSIYFIFVEVRGQYCRTA